jgi:hypothetical protein
MPPGIPFQGSMTIFRLVSVRRDRHIAANHWKNRRKEFGNRENRIGKGSGFSFLPAAFGMRSPFRVKKCVTD